MFPLHIVLILVFKVLDDIQRWGFRKVPLNLWERVMERGLKSVSLFTPRLLVEANRISR